MGQISQGDSENVPIYSSGTEIATNIASVPQDISNSAPKNETYGRKCHPLRPQTAPRGNRVLLSEGSSSIACTSHICLERRSPSPTNRPSLTNTGWGGQHAHPENRSTKRWRRMTLRDGEEDRKSSTEETEERDKVTEEKEESIFSANPKG